MISRFLLCMLLALPSVAAAYDERDHRSVTIVALEQSELGRDAERRKRLGIDRPVEHKGQLYSNSKRLPATIRDLVADGAKFEDEGLHSLNHFFNPTTGKGLQMASIAPRYPMDWLPSGIVALNNITRPSPDWALVTSGNDFGFARLKGYYFAGLTASAPQVRRDNMGLAFETLGRLVHHIQDMAQPQHVRNDAHWYEENLQGCDRTKVGAFVCDAYLTLSARSAYEQWTRELKLDFAKFTQYPAIFDGSVGQPTPSPIHFWTNAGRGLADFTNRNFRSVGTMDVAPPVLWDGRDILASELCAGAVPVCTVQDLDHVVSFWESFVDDQLRPSTSANNTFAAAASIFEWDFRQYAPTGQRPFTLNRFTFERAHTFLLPRAIGYSTGFINYFFRGDMDFAPPDEGVFAAVDLKSCGVPCGFRVVKLRVKNTTPNDAMGAGTLRIVAKYRLNTCHVGDLSGEDGGPAFVGETCRSPDELVAVSDPQTVASVPTGPSVPIAFSFPGGTPIPINASDLSLQVVFRGKLGEEDDAIAVSTLDVAEPNFLAVGNLSDHYFSDGQDRYFRLPSGQLPTSLSTVTFSFNNPATAPPLATLTSLQGGEHAQLAFITTKMAPNFWLRMNSAVYSPYFDDTALEVDEFFKDEEAEPAGPYTRSCQVRLERGRYRQLAGYYVERLNGQVGMAEPVVTGALSRPVDGISAKYRSNCAGAAEPGSGGLYDFSSMTPLFSSSNAKAWAINFP